MGQINTNNYPTVNSLLDADLLIVENATHGTGTTTPKQLRENAIGTDTLHTSAQSVTGAINELKGEIDAGAGVVCYDVDTITSGYLGQFSGSANLLLLHLTTDGIADATNGYMMMLSYSRPVARFAYGRLVDADGVAYKQDVYADNTIICKISNSGEGTESDPVQVVILGIINAGFMLTPTAVVSDRDIQDGQGNTLSVLAEALTKTASGNPVVISDCAGGKARSLKTTINAIQDLHGYDKPWVGGAGKNKLEYPYVTASSTINGVTFTVNSDGTVKANGTATANVSFVLSNKQRLDKLASGTYIMNGCPTGGAPDGTTYFLGLYAPNKSAYDFGSGANISLSGNEDTSANVYIRIANGYTANNLVFKPMLRLSTESDATFAPYSNICPISGRSSVVLTRSDGDEISEDFTIQLGQTVYGADINWDTGVMTVKTAILAKNTADMDNNEDYPGWRNSGIRALVGGGINRIITGINTNCGTAYGVNTTGESGDVVLLPKDYYGGKTQTEWIVLAMDIQIPATLATPTTIQLTPTQLQMLKGYNRVSIDNGSIELGYIAKLT